MMNARDREKIGQIIAERNIKYLVHFTPLENLDSILQNGLYSRYYIEYDPDSSNIINGVCLDNVRADNRKNGICLSVQFPNQKMFYSHRQKFGGEWAVIALDIKLILEIEDRQIQFFSTNSANAIFRQYDDKWLESSEAFEAMFAKMVENKNGILHRSPFIDSYYTTDVQAEVMVAKHIEKKYILAIALDKPELVKQYDGLYNQNKENPVYEFEYVKWIFQQRE
ncbi:DarT ssDNA thymidine ADP-ribosyltransferase family protein [Kingella kingae]|uniref:DarT ssDNA thymidine ADP-ribosyltransferase family protein n=1 Tax=Kingella kingae TaxID=504 RepID=UPI00254F6DA1|nr:DarT ssDNA thymidine ADP-ribosyltransferase family protein [Kingella kingae]MDK4530052.1 DarT ssDNA thymidine ADP-ribosyltransferase family protein [Kingella kingae]MDK4580584.1 DarT ssDNA thymidine ADP-ribosyltransferase family protein [Kingella kingae]MDK4596719.1 DarT ssDNA thymidine ADP-ribosyltransferase family protein [Kingella kingae]MDK4600664.1 DarT ssDNA thymidine ADP-ribosyltransferase family protein [Kingella kingae]MDK4654377.1 DarT ssDNA thymidine ADP-ribosyltransferase family